MTKADREQEAARVMRWIAEHRELLDTIVVTSHHDDMGAKDFAGILDLLQEERMEYLIPVFLYLSSTTCVMDYCLKPLFFQGAADRMNRFGFGEVIKQLENTLWQYEKEEELCHD